MLVISDKATSLASHVRDILSLLPVRPLLLLILLLNLGDLPACWV